MESVLTPATPAFTIFFSECQEGALKDRLLLPRGHGSEDTSVRSYLVNLLLSMYACRHGVCTNSLQVKEPPEIDQSWS